MRKELVTYREPDLAIECVQTARFNAGRWLRTVLEQHKWDHHTLKHLLGLTPQEALRTAQGFRPMTVAEMMIIALITGCGIKDIADAVTYKPGPYLHKTGPDTYLALPPISHLEIERLAREARFTIAQSGGDPAPGDISGFITREILGD